MSSPTSPFMDHAAPILAGDPALSDQNRADLWDAFHQSKDPQELVQRLAPLVVPDDTKHRLFQAKQASMPVAPPVDKVTAAIQKMTTIDPQTLELAEAHPNVLKAITSAATTPEKAPSEPAAATSPAGKGTKAPEAEKPAPLAQPMRPDGLENLPPIPDDHHRILASDGSIHDIPVANLDKARKIDPLLHVLNP